MGAFLFDQIKGKVKMIKKRETKFTVGGVKNKAIVREGIHMKRLTGYVIAMTFLLCSVTGSSVFAGMQVAGGIESGETKTGNITTAGQMDSYTFTANNGDTVTILMGSSSGLSYPLVELHGPGGLVASNTNYYSATIEAQKLSGLGTYYITCSAANGYSTGQYGVSLIKNPGSPNSTQDPDGGTIQSGESKNGNIGLGDLDACTFQANVKDRATILMGSSSGLSYPLVELHGPDGNVIISDSDYYTAKIQDQQLDQTGTYYIICRANNGYSTGPYGISLALVPGCTFSISPTDILFQSNGGAGTVTVTTSLTDCIWSSTSNTPWITITAGNTGIGNGTVHYSVSSNISTGKRTGIITIAGQTVTITQEGECSTWDDVIEKYQDYVNKPCQLQ